MSAHVHAKMMALYALDAAETDKPWERWEEYRRSELIGWISVNKHPEWDDCTEYRRKPRTIHINGIEVPEPCREPLEGVTHYYMPDLVESAGGSSSGLSSGWVWSAWDDDEVDHARLKAGIVHLTKEAAEMHAKALVSFTEAKSCEE
jgi:hypothetical protein